MPLNLQSIRELNKVHFYVTCCEDPAAKVLSGIDTDNTGVAAALGAGAHAWTFDMYQTGGLSLDSNIQTTQKMGNRSTDRKLRFIADTIGGLGLGIVPQIDYPHKFIYSGSDVIRFNLSCYLVLETDVFQDFYAPLLRLLFLTYPTRFGEALITQEGSINTAGFVDGVLDGLPTEDVKKYKDDFVTWIRKAEDWVSKAGDYVSDVLGDSFTKYAQLLKESTIDTFRESYALRVPPPFMSRFTGGLDGMVSVSFMGTDVAVYPVAGSTGISMSYGSMYLPDIFFKSINISVPELYYEGGFPQVIEVKLSCETIRVATANSMFKALSGQINDN